jgi:hypothetical protein
LPENLTKLVYEYAENLAKILNLEIKKIKTGNFYELSHTFEREVYMRTWLYFDDNINFLKKNLPHLNLIKELADKVSLAKNLLELNL